VSRSIGKRNPYTTRAATARSYMASQSGVMNRQRSISCYRATTAEPRNSGAIRKIKRMMPKRLLIGLAGASESGKTTAADILIEHFYFHRYSVIWEVRDFCQQMLGGQVELWWGQKSDWSRDILIRMCKLIREARPDAFVNTFSEHMLARDGGYLIVVDDVRFPEEIEMIRQWGGQVWLINRAGKIKNAQDYDLVIDNSGSIDDLREMVFAAYARSCGV
jgi:hypothetical protein